VGQGPPASVATFVFCLIGGQGVAHLHHDGWKRSFLASDTKCAGIGHFFNKFERHAGFQA